MIWRMKKETPPYRLTEARREQYRRASAARRAKGAILEVLLPFDLDEVLAKAAADHAGGKHGYALDVLARHFQRKGLYSPPAPPES